MAKLVFLIAFLICLIGCNPNIKNSVAKITIEDGTAIDTSNKDILPSEVGNNYKGYWVGYFEEDNDEDNSFNEVSEDGVHWNRENKINISIDTIVDSLVIGHSVVAGNNRPFKGLIKNEKFVVREPGHDKYDGVFEFAISNNTLTGKWKAYKNIEINKRKYSLEKKKFVYNPNIMLEKSQEYIEWNKFTEKKEKIEYEKDDFEDWIRREYVSATELIYSINASNTILKKKDVENLKRGDLLIIRNTIYARHGYSFKNRPLRVFFDAQEWYIPIHNDIRSEFSEIEKKNIELLLRYEKNAAEYYDYFGRG